MYRAHALAWALGCVIGNIAQAPGRFCQLLPLLLLRDCNHGEFHLAATAGILAARRGDRRQRHREHKSVASIWGTSSVPGVDNIWTLRVRPHRRLKTVAALVGDGIPTRDRDFHFNRVGARVACPLVPCPTVELQIRAASCACCCRGGCRCRWCRCRWVRWCRCRRC